MAMTLSVLALVSLKGLYSKVRDHFIKVMSVLGVGILGLDTAQLKGFADQYLDEKYAHYIGIALFVFCFARASWISWGSHANK